MPPWGAAGLRRPQEIAHRVAFLKTQKRMQWCLLALGMNDLPARAGQHAQIDRYLASFDGGKPMSVPGIRH